ncbi:hypothetical protein M440DRAFT_1444273 [Trichoderma longibrachiatum ATCC 18648]|uniref:Uncharacterized protein n=1 Tax=Trichoderma longibrachiatum ATCC 18648 TaxID=983965 RepID=A0A2T4CJL0_TRILO|nr:hypothetical protein M440DRAFT_1444273 [Trichoderma longibrachiatum ATCC 18648]
MRRRAKPLQLQTHICGLSIKCAEEEPRTAGAPNARHQLRTQTVIGGACGGCQIRPNFSNQAISSKTIYGVFKRRNMINAAQPSSWMAVVRLRRVLDQFSNTRRLATYPIHRRQERRWPLGPMLEYNATPPTTWTGTGSPQTEQTDPEERSDRRRWQLVSS